MLNVKFDTSKLMKNFPKVSKQVEESVFNALKKTALEDVETPAKLRCRVDTGRLRASIHTEYFGRSGKLSISPKHKFFGRSGKLSISPKHKFEVVVGTNVIYAVYVERRYPYLFPALENSRSALLQRLKSAIKVI